MIRAHTPVLDFNCDLGEGCGSDADILPWITSANIACGGHAGDDVTMRETLRLCRRHGVVAGAHPSYADRAHFGRREHTLDAGALRALLHAQLARIAAIAQEEGVLLRHVKPHGALYNLAARDEDTARVIAEAVRDFDSGLRLVGLSGSRATAAGEAAGLRVAHEVFAERGYDAQGRLLARDLPGAVIETLQDALAQARALALHGRVRTPAGETLVLRADTLCLHGDRADAAAFARALREALQADGVRVQSLDAPT